jgi:centractin
MILTRGAGFGQRVKNEMEKLAVKGTKIKIFAPPERKYTTWIGGSILAALGTFRKANPSIYHVG